MKLDKILFLAALLGAGCSNGGGGAPAAGEIALCLTDAASDELAQFEVDVRNIVFTSRSGAMVSVLPRATRVDFVQLESVAELVVARGLEAGVYTRIALTLDFQGAEVLLHGQTVPATGRDANGDVLAGPVEVVIDLAAGSQPTVGSLRRHLYVLDLDLDQSVAVNSAANEVTFSPAIDVAVDPSAPKPIATTGILRSVDPVAGSFTVERRSTDGVVVCTFTVRTASTTVFQLDGAVSVGAAGLGSLAAHLGGRVFVQGTLDAETIVLDALAVESGTGVPGNGQDWVLGHVVSRTGGAGVDPTLAVLGHSVDFGPGTRRYGTLHTVNLSKANTKVLRRGTGNALDSDAVNVGQLVWVFGDLTGTNLDASGSTGVARLLVTSLYGIAAGPATGDLLTLNLTRIGLLPRASFAFTVSGQPQADPDAFTVDVTGLATAGLGSGSRVRVLGWIAAVGAAGADATALSLVDRTTAGKVLFCQWSPASTGAIAGTSATAITLDVANALIAAVGDGFAPVALQPAPPPTIRPALGLGFYTLVEGRAVELHFGWNAFQQALAARAATDPVFRIGAAGTYAATTQVFTALAVTVVFH
ncbi:MAG: DUF4382 domain-containing protein [Planctomycetes bacterium]|nr:DUF4382 domain-containing protein [Planctomycetota bacterium]